MRSKILTLATVAALAIGTAGLAATASAATPAVNPSAVTTAPDSNVQTVGVRRVVRRHIRRLRFHGHSARPHGHGHHFAFRCFRLRRLALAGDGRARGTYYRIGCHRTFGPIRG